ncbi:hypothetical protein [Paraburkholderia bannensis]|uniref:hypothetical protein n=1 Tax=Paraburkholderia bannensis TaxID=765414 RepID=UPI002AB61598|nr:hypothetical protein [Paraburkholderia bannensis]
MRAASGGVVDASRGSWLREPCSLTQVCAVVDHTTPPEIVKALCDRFGSAPQVCVLELHDAAQLHAQWLASFSTPSTLSTLSTDATRSPTDADRLLAPLPPACVLALCSQEVGKLDWLGSVTGRPCKPIALDAGVQAEAVLEAVGAVWMEALNAQFGGER